jgi:ribosomal protein L11 methyltransferase
VPVPEEDLASTILWEMGTTGIEVRTAAGETVLSAYFPARAVSLPELARAFAAVPGARVEPAELLVVDWTARFKESFRAFAAGGFFIVPVWAPESAGEGHRILVDPGQAFGTGTHESTRLSLAALESVFAERPPRRVLDVGTGSGILSIAARLLGAELAVGLEIDPEALIPAREHAAFNHAEVAFVRGDGARCIRAGAFDLVLANISAPLVIARAAELVAACRPGGDLVLAGLLRYDVADVRAAYEPLADAIAVSLEGEWASLLVRTRG